MIPHRNKILALIAALVLAYAIYRPLLAYYLGSIVESYGFSDVELYIEDIGFNGITLTNVRTGDINKPLIIPEIIITYTPYQLLEARVDKIIVKKPFFDVHVRDGKTLITGLESWLSQPSKTHGNKVLPAELLTSAGFKFDKLSVEDASIRLLGYGADTTMGFNLTVSSKPNPLIEFKAPAFSGNYNGDTFSVSDIFATIILNEEQAVWEGSWGTEGASYKKGTSDIPSFRIKGSIRAEAALVLSDMSMDSAQSPVQVSAQLKAKPDQNIFLMKSATLPMAGGMISVQNILLPIRENKILNTMVTVSKLSLNEIMQLLTSNRASATGEVSGTLPIGINSNGSIIFYPGELRADKPGTIMVEPQAIPSNNAQIEILRTVLGNFHYNNLVMKVESGTGNNLDVLLTLDGKSPDAYKGRPVKLNVHLTGDLLNVIQQTFLPIANPNKFLKKEAP